MRFAHVIFDCDGVLVDTEAISRKVEASLMEGLELPLAREELMELFLGKSTSWQAEWLASHVGEERARHYETEHAARMQRAFEQHVAAVPHVREALEVISLPKSVATNGIRPRATFALQRTGLFVFFDRLTTIEDVKEGKPAPDIYLLAAERAGVTPQHCAVIEDSPTGVAAACAAGMTVIGFTGTAHDASRAADDLRRAGAHMILDDMRALHTALDWA